MTSDAVVLSTYFHSGVLISRSLIIKTKSQGQPEFYSNSSITPVQSTKCKSLEIIIKRKLVAIVRWQQCNNIESLMGQLSRFYPLNVLRRSEILNPLYKLETRLNDRFCLVSSVGIIRNSEPSRIRCK